MAYQPLLLCTTTFSVLLSSFCFYLEEKSLLVYGVFLIIVIVAWAVAYDEYAKFPIVTPRSERFLGIVLIFAVSTFGAVRNVSKDREYMATLKNFCSVAASFLKRFFSITARKETIRPAPSEWSPLIHVGKQN